MKFSPQVDEIRRKSLIFEAHIDNFEAVARRNNKEPYPFLEGYCTRLIEHNVDSLIMVVGGDGSHQRAGSILPLHGSLDMVDLMLQDIEADPNRVTAIRWKEDVPAEPDGRVHVFLELEGGESLEQSLANLRNYFRLGVRGMQLTHNLRNELGDGVWESRTKGGLSRWGIRVIREMNRLGMLIGVSHLTQAGVRDALEASEAPIVASHSNACAVHDIPHRNLYDEQMKSIAEKGGAIGIHWLDWMIDSEKPTLSKYLDHIDHSCQVVGPQHIGIGYLGTDSTHAQVFKGKRLGLTLDDGPGGIGRDVQYNLVIDGLLKRGYSEEDIAWILGGSFLRVIKAVMPKQGFAPGQGRETPELPKPSR